MNIIDVEGVKLNLEEKGAGPTVVFVHGTSQDYRVWTAQVEALSKDYRTICYSRRCALPNQSRDFASSSVENNVKDLAGLISNVGGGPVNLVGQSYGGAIAVLCALRRSNLVRSLVLIEPFLPTLIGDPNSKAQMLSLLLRKPSVARSGLKSMKYMKAMMQELDQKNGENALKLLVDALQDGHYPIDKYPATIRALMLDNVETARETETPYPRFTKEEAKQVLQPTLLLTGVGSTKVLKAIVEEMHRNMPNNQVVEISKAAHFPHFENPAACNAAITKFLAERSA
jgi:pimeloyl-ACP methyl ester carboxylesterase